MTRTRNEGTCIKEIPFGQSLELKFWGPTKGWGWGWDKSGETAWERLSRAVVRNLDVILRAMERIGRTFSRGIIEPVWGLDTFRQVVG